MRSLHYFRFVGEYVGERIMKVGRHLLKLLQKLGLLIAVCVCLCVCVYVYVSVCLCVCVCAGSVATPTKTNGRKLH